MNILKVLIAIALLLACYQSRAQQANDKKKRMFFYPSKDTPTALAIKNLKVYPNPASQQVQIELPETPGKEGFMLEVSNMKGQCMLSQKWNGEKLNVSQFQSGIYIVTLRKDRQYYSQKLVVKRE
ncbi:T9SS type A sorting domain-containing protein [Dyadobacter pollutisoli]|uniref:T9SS type A sorting domain-containing protein n=1 Tax=Dyadobacter pollutisoli TaxID=2910158 RepID=A0A9E8NGI0_9BACT|nr:T9SS type A sorting domain-containing protein [Dyadobacter pollutisoli]WAC14541.1 T9SS type A sorting domain-containing protein [Dyadobacter pollutisoli]